MEETLLALARKCAEQSGEKTAYVFLDGMLDCSATLSYSELDQKARAVASRLQVHVAQGDRVLLLLDLPQSFIIGFLGCIYAGVTPVPAVIQRKRARGLKRLHAIAADCGPTCMLTEEKYSEILAEADLPLPVFIEDIGVDEAAQWSVPDIKPDDLAFLQYTSGSTGQPKGVRVSHRNIIDNESAIRRAFGTQSDDVILGWLPLFHDMGLIGNVLHPLYLGAQCILMQPATFVSRPLNWLQAISRYRATVSGGPDFAYRLCVELIDAAETAELDLSSWRVAFNGAEPVRAATVRAFTERYSSLGFSVDTMLPCYGLAESTLLVSAKAPGRPPLVLDFDADALRGGRAVSCAGAQALVSSGVVQSGLDLRIVDPDRRIEVPEGTSGEIWLHGASVAQGYWGDREATEAGFNAMLAEGLPAVRYLRTGDVGFMFDSELFVSGRLKEVIIVRGRNYFPADIESCVQERSDALVRGAGVAFVVGDGSAERLVVVQEVVRTHLRKVCPESLLAKARAGVANEFGLTLDSLVLTRPGSVPKTTSGKLRRLYAREMYAQGEFEAIQSADPGVSSTEALDAALPARSPSRQPLLDILSTRFGVPVADQDLSFAELGVDSILGLQIVAWLQDEYAIEVDIDAFMKCSINSLVRRIDETGPVVATGFAPPVHESLSWTERHFLHLHHNCGAPSALNVWVAFRTDRALDPARLRAAVDRICAENPVILRRFEEASPQSAHLSFDTLPIDSLDAMATGGPTMEAIAAYCQRPFDLPAGPLMRLGLASENDGSLLAVVAHHALADMLGLLAFCKRMLALHDDGSAMPLSVPDREDPLDAFRRRQSARSLAGRSHWRSVLHAFAGPSRNALLEALPAGDANSMLRRMPAEFGAALSRISAIYDCSRFVAAMAAFAVAAHRHSGDDRLIICSPISGRSRPEWMDRVGAMVNPAWIGSALGPASSPSVFVGALTAAIGDALRMQEAHVFCALSNSGVSLDTDLSALNRFSFAYQSNLRTEGLGGLICGEDGAEVVLDGWRLRAVGNVPRPHTMAHIECFLHDDRSGCLLRIDWAQRSASMHRVEALMDDIVDAAELLCDTRYASMDALMSALSDRRAPRSCASMPCEVGDPLADLFERSFAMHADAIAVQHSDLSITYRQLHQRAAACAAILRRRGVKVGDAVAVMPARDAHLVPLLLAVWMLGAHYVPLDGSLPAARIRDIVHRSGAVCLIAGDRFLPLPALDAVQVLSLEAIAAEAPGETPLAGWEPRHRALPAYVIFTSGSTGAPKGVRIDRAALANFVRQIQSTGPFSCCPSVLALTTLLFDISLTEFAFPLASGAKIVLANDAEVADPRMLTALIARTRPALVQTTPSRIRQLQREGLEADARTHVLLCGEALPQATAESLRGAASLWNMYGPTEAAVLACGEEVGDSCDIGIGTALPGTALYVLDESGRPVPEGVRGELHISGLCLAHGYVGEAALTAARFLPDPFSDGTGGRMYRTGDVVHRGVDGRLRYHGRVDHQVKLRGYRIELAEVEAALGGVSGVEQSIAMIEGSGDDATLVARIVVAQDAPDEFADTLYAALYARLPIYMIPGRIERVSGFRIGPTGKIDRAAAPLDPRPLHEPAAAQSLPTTKTEHALIAIWERALDGRVVGKHDNFFALGGNSLSAAVIAAAVRADFGTDIPARVLYELQTVAAMAGFVDASVAAETSADRVETVFEI